MISDHSLFSYYESQQGAANGHNPWLGRFTGKHRVLDEWMLARAHASPARDLYCHGPMHYNLPYLCIL